MENPARLQKNKHIVALSVAAITKALNKKGLRVERSSDFRRLFHLAPSLKGYKQSQQSSIQFHDFTGNGYWFALYNKKDVCVGVQAVRMDKLYDLNLAEHWAQQQWRIYEGGTLGSDHAPLVYEISGDVAYQGDMWVDKSCRGDNVAILLTQLCYLQSVLEFENLTHIYAFMRVDLAKRGLPYKTLFNYCLPCGTDWIVEPKGIDRRDCFIASSALDIFHHAKVINTYGPESEVYTQVK